MQIFKLSSNIQVRLWGSFINRIANNSILPFLALYLSQELNKTLAGSYLLLITIVMFGSNFISGYIGDRINRKTLLLIFSYLEALFAIGMFFSIYKNNIFAFLIAYLFSVIFTSFKKPLVTAIIQDAITKDIKKYIYRIEYWLSNLSIAIGISIGGLLYENHKLLLFSFLTISTTFLAILYTLFLKDYKNALIKSNNNNIVKDFIDNYVKVFSDKRYVLLTLGSALILSAEFCTTSYLSVKLSEEFKTVFIMNYKIDGIRMFSIINIINTVTVVSLTFLVSKIIDKYYVKKVLIIGLILYSFGYFILNFTNSWWVILISIFIATIGELIYAPLKNTKQFELIPSDKRSTYASFMTLSFTIADSIGKSFLISSKYLSSTTLAFFLLFLLTSGSILLYVSLFYKNVRL